jgi:hypothetical protein
MCGVMASREWKRGPDGNKSLCAACGAHYAKMLKSEQLHTVKPQCITSISALVD